MSLNEMGRRRRSRRIDGAIDQNPHAARRASDSAARLAIPAPVRPSCGNGPIPQISM
jgi:hypothetical protein